MGRVVDFIRLFDKVGQSYTLTGQHSAGNIGVNCPFCYNEGDPDPSEHLGINLGTGAWNCWRSRSHRGARPHKLLLALLGMSAAKVDALIGDFRANQDDFESLFGRDPFAEKKKFRPFGLTSKSKEEAGLFVSLESGMAVRHKQYLVDRKINPPLNSIFAGVIGKWANRIILPLRLNGEVVTWTARKISEMTHGPKYLTLKAATEEDGFGGMNIKDLIYDMDNLGNKNLIVVEGPLDARNLSQYTQNDVTCLFGTSMTVEQAARIWKLSKQCERVFFLFDNDAFPQACIAASEFSNAEAVDISVLGVSDPGEITADKAMSLEKLGL